MSGTSLDGVDLAYIEFIYADDATWKFNLKNSKSIPYNISWKNKLTKAMEYNGLELNLLDIELGNHFAELINLFRTENNITQIDFIASHGHTIYHQPEKKLSLQIGAGQIIAANTGIEVICDFRKQDLALGGQGAPLVPIGDRLLFSEYTFCLNIGGIANISFEYEKERIAFDVCPANMVLNYYANKLGLDFDEDGMISSKGSIQLKLLEELNSLDYYELPAPKSLGKEWVVDKVIPLIESYTISIEDKLKTFTEHVAMQIAGNIRNILEEEVKSSIFITGGGTLNAYLISRLGFYTRAKIIIPSQEIIDFKEAIIFGFLGVLRKRNENNCLSSVTGASRDHSSGVIYSL